ncbi:MAG TPA: DUF6259 domain-containing protein, partial [Candidatus Hydrogenedentes bacterium]|nr:DUF6259 domain-containing protein [Candidatus Hydrogenedentota bacterium]
MKGELFLLIPFILAIGVSFAGAQNLLCENDSVSIEFSGHNGTVLRFYDKANGCDITRADDGELWRVMLTTESGTKVLTPSDAGQFISHSNSPSEIQMSWFDFPGMDKDLAIHASVRIQTCWPPTSWELVIHKTPSARVPVAHFPRLSNLTKHEEESLAVPVWTGQLLPNPRSVLCASDDARLAWNYPGMMAMQCVAYCAKGGSGLYAACDDTAAYRKTFAFWGNVSGKVDFEMVHYPENGAANSGEWRMPYAAILGALHGDWFDAAERYRSWALQQTWTKESRMRRGLVPAWIEETGMWIWNRGRSEGVLPPAIALQETLGLPVRVFWHWWHGCPYDAGFPEYLPPREGADQFRKAVLDAHAHDVRCVVYMNQRLWGMETESWRVENAERFAVKGEDGKVHPEVYNLFTKSPMASMCIATPFWRGAYAGLAQRAITELGVDGIYMDQACDSMPCYDSSHGHPIGGGRYWLDGFRLLSGDIRKRAAEKRVALTGEGCCEAWLPYLDAMLTLQVSKERYSAPTDP